MWTAILFIAVLVVLILVHEFGHFLFAKLFGVKVEEFGVGYPPRALKLFKIGETEYTLNWLPFGGFVKLLGENPDDNKKNDPEYKERALVNKHPAKQLLVLLGGVLFNFLFAWILFTYVFLSGVPLFWDKNYIKNSELVINGVMENSPAFVAGLDKGDIIYSIALKDTKANEEKTPVNLSPDAVSRFISKHPGETIIIDYFDKSENKRKLVDIVPSQGVLKEDPSTAAIGVSLVLMLKKQIGFADAIVLGFKSSVDVFVDVCKGIAKLFTDLFEGNANLKNVAGPVGIAKYVSDAASVGFAYLLYFMALISVNLSVINLLPLPALDGGRAIIVLIEWISRRKIPTVVVNSLNVVGFALLIVLMIIVTYKDITKLLS